MTGVQTCALPISANEASRGVRVSRWPVADILRAGYGLATMYYGDIDPDRDDFTDGVHPLFIKMDKADLRMMNGVRSVPGPGD